MVIVTLLACLERFIGFVYRVYLSRVIGAEGLAVYQIALSVVGVIIMLTSSGIPITVSRLMLKERARKNPVGEQEVVSAGIFASIAISLPITLCLYFFRDSLSFIFTDPKCYDVLIIILPGITITSVYAVIRGYFWGNRQYLKYSLIELGEEVVMVVAGIILVSRSPDGFTGAKRAGTAVLISYVASFVASSAIFIFTSGRLKNPLRRLKPLIVSSSPITAMRTLTALTGTLVSLVVPARLVYYGAETSSAMSQFGTLSGMAMPLLFIPSTIIGSIALVLVPEIAESYYKNDKTALKNSVERSVDACALISALIIPVFISCGKNIGSFIYESEQAGFYLSLSAFTMLPMSVSMITGSLLNSVNQEKKTLVNYLIGALLMLAVIWFAPVIMGIYSLILAYFLSYTVTAVLNLISLKKVVPEKTDCVKTIAICALSAGVSAFFGALLGGIVKYLADILVIIICGAACSLFNITLLFVFGVFKDNLSYVSEKLKIKKTAR